MTASARPLVRQPFAIDHRALKFLLGGGSSPATRMDLLVDGKVVRTASGEDISGVTEPVWDVAEFKGRQGLLQIVDASSDAWGHLVVDRIMLSDALTSAPWVEDPKDFLTLRPVQQTAGSPWPDNCTLPELDLELTRNWQCIPEHDLAPSGGRRDLATAVWPNRESCGYTILHAEEFNIQHSTSNIQ
ncbi:MAG: hypothetical protein NTW21_28170 [Verrucomicrobia bacterium]|nr:hypothetical protein [Verrucomicrobiota bacterium]